MLKDILGNELKVGDFVHLQLPSNLVLAKITEISEGGLLGASAIVNQRAQAMIIPGSVEFSIEFNTNFDPKVAQIAVNKATIPQDSPLNKIKNAKDAKPN